MRALIDISKESIEKLDFFAKQSHVSRASLIRKAIEDFLENQKPLSKNAFGLLKNEDLLDGVEFQKKTRDEWI
jgi:metal-responsive CopG/Arc/MetJ family transcriptional regulator